MITIFARVVYTYVLSSFTRPYSRLLKIPQNKTTLIATGGTVGLAEWIIDGTHVLKLIYISGHWLLTAQKDCTEEAKILSEKKNQSKTVIQSANKQSSTSPSRQLCTVTRGEQC